MSAPVENPIPIAKAITIIGVPSVIALFLVYILAGAIRDEILNLRSEIQRQREQIAEMAGALRHICLNTATSDTDRDRCTE